MCVQCVLVGRLLIISSYIAIVSYIWILRSLRSQWLWWSTKNQAIDGISQKDSLFMGYPATLEEGLSRYLQRRVNLLSTKILASFVPIQEIVVTRLVESSWLFTTHSIIPITAYQIMLTTSCYTEYQTTHTTHCTPHTAYHTLCNTHYIPSTEYHSLHNNNCIPITAYNTLESFRILPRNMAGL